MCLSYFTQHPHCGCMHSSAVIRLCSLYTGLPENKNKMTFRPKLVTSHCQGLNLYFDGIDFRSIDVQGCDMVPDGLDCPEVEVEEVPGEKGRCPLCDNPGVLKFLKAKGIEPPPGTSGDLRDEAEEGAAEDAGGKGKGKAVDKSGGGWAERAVGKSSGKGGVVDYRNRAREMLERARSALAGKRARSDQAVSPTAAMGWD